MDKCKACGGDVPEINLFCTNCGAQVATDEEIRLSGDESEKDLATSGAKVGLTNDKRVLKTLEVKKNELERELKENTTKLEELERFQNELEEWSRLNRASSSG